MRPLRQMQWNRAVLTIALLLAGCAKKTPVPVAAAPAPPPEWPVRSPDFIDLVPDSNVREVIPLFASGGFVAKGLAQENGFTITLTGTDFRGYETALYAMKPRDDGRGVTPELTSATTTKDDQTAPVPAPRVPLFQYPGSVRYIRLLYLIRVSEADHDMAVLASDDVDRLNELTKQVQSDPSNCHDGNRIYCTWVPQGIAVTPDTGARAPQVPTATPSPAPK